MDLLFGLFGFLHVLAAFSMLATLALVIKLYLETDKGWYWLCLVLSILLIAISQCVDLLFPPGLRGFMIIGLLSEICQIAGGLLLAVSFYGMYRTMKSIRKRIE